MSDALSDVKEERDYSTIFNHEWFKKLSSSILLKYLLGDRDEDFSKNCSGVSEPTIEYWLKSYILEQDGEILSMSSEIDSLKSKVENIKKKISERHVNLHQQLNQLISLRQNNNKN